MKWDPADVCLLILTITVPISLLGIIAIRLVTGSPVSEVAGGIVMDMVKVIGGGVLGIIGTLLSNKNKQP